MSGVAGNSSFDPFVNGGGIPTHGSRAELNRLWETALAHEAVDVSALEPGKKLNAWKPQDTATHKADGSGMGPSWSSELHFYFLGTFWRVVDWWKPFNPPAPGKSFQLRFSFLHFRLRLSFLSV